MDYSSATQAGNKSRRFIFFTIVITENGNFLLDLSWEYLKNRKNLTSSLNENNQCHMTMMSTNVKFIEHNVCWSPNRMNYLEGTENTTINSRIKRHAIMLTNLTTFAR